jgi:hypothetical protein
LSAGRKQSAVLRLLIERIDVAPDISLRIHAAGIRSLVGELSMEVVDAEPVHGAMLEAAE